MLLHAASSFHCNSTKHAKGEGRCSYVEEKDDHCQSVWSLLMFAHTFQDLNCPAASCEQLARLVRWGTSKSPLALFQVYHGLVTYQSLPPLTLPVSNFKHAVGNACIASSSQSWYQDKWHHHTAQNHVGDLQNDYEGLRSEEGVNEDLERTAFKVWLKIADETACA